MDRQAWQVLFVQMFSGSDGWMDWWFHLIHTYRDRDIYSNRITLIQFDSLASIDWQL
jgi:hypothetical protein